MPLLKWDTKYSVGVSAMDHQHTILFELLNELHDAMAKGRDRASLCDLLARLSDYAHQHFAEEEQLITSNNYPEVAVHHELHRELLQQITEFQGRLGRGDLTLSLHLLNFLRDWLTHHIQKVDRNYGIWLNERGIH
jgi:hemerythrin-like metal-binding protein